MRSWISSDRLRALILSPPCGDAAKDRVERDKFASMIHALGRGGVEAQHRFADQAEEMERALSDCDPDLVFCSAHHVQEGSGGLVNAHAVLEALGMPYVGPKPEVIDLALAKGGLKARWEGEGVDTPEGFTVGPAVEGSTALLEKARDFPYIVKPNKEGNSRGIDESSVVWDTDSLRSKIELTLDAYGEVLVERFLGAQGESREFTAAMVGGVGGMLVMPMEIRLEGKRKYRIVTNGDKDDHRTSVIPISERELRERIRRFAAKAFEAAAVRDYSRCDMILSEGRLYAIEVNGQPMVPDRWFELCARDSGLDQDQYINAIFLAAISRISREGRGRPPPEAMRELLSRETYEILTVNGAVNGVANGAANGPAGGAQGRVVGRRR
jgi:D-alanine-D-alanine ligase